MDYMEKYRQDIADIRARYVRDVDAEKERFQLECERIAAARKAALSALHARTRKVAQWLIGFLAGVCIVALVSALLASCITTRPVSAVVNPDGTVTGVSKQVVFLRGYDQAAAIAVAMDNADVKVYGTSTVQRRLRAFGSGYITTVTGTR